MKDFKVALLTGPQAHTEGTASCSHKHKYPFVGAFGIYLTQFCHQRYSSSLMDLEFKRSSERVSVMWVIITSCQAIKPVRLGVVGEPILRGIPSSHSAALASYLRSACWYQHDFQSKALTSPNNEDVLRPPETKIHHLIKTHLANYELSQINLTCWSVSIFPKAVARYSCARSQDVTLVFILSSLCNRHKGIWSWQQPLDSLSCYAHY